ncbi:MAG: hypothetical protein SFU56_05870 [Capsulimonadales bacterium]|nr:hypothetical protein [Capsulimonadales bacterium]
MSTTTQKNPAAQFRQWQTLAVGMAVLGIFGLIAGFAMDHKAFYTSFMFAWVFWGGLSLGATTLTYLHHTIRAQWSVSILRVAEAANKTLPIMGLLLLAVTGFGILNQELYQWSNPEIIRGSELLQRKTWFLNKEGFFFWSIAFFIYWLLTTRFLNASSRKQDDTLDDRLAERRATFAAPLGVLHVVFLTFAVTYWIMSLDPAWFSTIYGVWFMIQELRLAIALGVIIVIGLRFMKPFSDIVSTSLCRDLGWMLEGLTMFWAYVSLSQFLIIWSGNLPEEITFYNNRFAGALVYLGAALIICQFLVPFIALLSYNWKRNPRTLNATAWWIFVFSAVDIWWQITPFFRVGLKVEDMPGYLLDLGAFAGVGGIWLFLFLGNLLAFARDGVLVPRHDTRPAEEKAALEAGHAH